MTVEFKKDYKVGDTVRVVDIDTMIKRGGDRNGDEIDFEDNAFVEDMYIHIGSEFTITKINRCEMIVQWGWHFSPEMLELVEDKDVESNNESEHETTCDLKRILANSKEQQLIEAYQMGGKLLKLHREMSEKGYEVDIYDDELHLHIKESGIYLNIK